MSESQLLQHYQMRLTSFSKHFDKTKQRLAAANIHALRVDIKRLRAILSLIELVDRKRFNKSEHFRLFSKLFKRAGKVREIQVNRQLLAAYDRETVEPFTKFLVATQRKAARNLKIVLQEFDNAHLETANKTLQQLSNELSDQLVAKKSAAFILRNLRKVNKLREQASDPKIQHRIRIELKAIIEILKLMEELFPAEELTALQKELQFSAEIIGDWHDQSVLLESVQRYTGTLPNRRPDRSTQLLMRKMKSSIARYQKQIEKDLDRFFDGYSEKPVQNWTRRINI